MVIDGASREGSQSSPQERFDDLRHDLGGGCAVHHAGDRSSLLAAKTGRIEGSAGLWWHIIGLDT